MFLNITGYLARQMFGAKSRAVVEAYEDCMSKPYGYIFFDYKQETPDKLRIKTNILPTDNSPCVVYVPK